MFRSKVQNDCEAYRTAELLHRRQLLKTSAIGFGQLAFASLLSRDVVRANQPFVDDHSRVDGSLTTSPLAPKAPHFVPKAKRILFLFMKGGPSHVDTFDPKPLLDRDHGKPLPLSLIHI